MLSSSSRTRDAPELRSVSALRSRADLNGAEATGVDRGHCGTFNETVPRRVPERPVENLQGSRGRCIQSHDHAGLHFAKGPVTLRTSPAPVSEHQPIARQRGLVQRDALKVPAKASQAQTAQVMDHEVWGLVKDLSHRPPTRNVLTATVVFRKIVSGPDFAIGSVKVLATSRAGSMAPRLHPWFFRRWTNVEDSMFARASRGERNGVA